jgi:hypothetical protein
MMIRNALHISAITLSLLMGANLGSATAHAAAERPASGSSSKETKDTSKGNYVKGKGSGTTSALKRTHSVRMIKSNTIGSDGQGTYFITVDGDLYKLVLGGDEDGVTIELFDRSRDLIVGYTADDSRVMIIDPKGVVEDSREEHTDLSSIGSYGAAAQLLTDPGFIQEMLTANGVDIGYDDADEPSAYWVLVAYLIARCVDVSVSGDFEGNASWEVNIDCF